MPSIPPVFCKRERESRPTVNLLVNEGQIQTASNDRNLRGIDLFQKFKQIPSLGDEVFHVI